MHVQWKFEKKYEKKKKNSHTRHTTQPYLLFTGSPEASASGCYWVFDVSMATLGVCWKTELYFWTCLVILRHFPFIYCFSFSDYMVLSFFNDVPSWS